MSRARVLTWVGAAALLVAALIWAAWPSGGSTTAGSRAHALATELRCPDCEGLSVADSSTPSAQAIRADLTRRTSTGESDATIRKVYVGRYGESILLNPPTSGLSLLVWVLPVVALAMGAGGLAFAFRRWRRQPHLIATDADEVLVRRARGA